MVLKRVGVWSAARIAGAIYAGLGFLFGCFFALAALLGAGFASAAGGDDAPPAFVGVVFGCGAVIFMPLLYGLLGMVTTAFSAWLYNIVAGMVGGLEVDVE